MNIPAPKVAVVILNWNGRKFLEQFLPSVMASTYPFVEIIVADNASTDDSVDFLKEHYPKVRIIINPGNEGFAKGYNTALKQIQSDYYVLLNSDVEVTPGWIEPVIALMEKEPRIAAAQPKILAWHQRAHFEYAGAAGGWIDQYGYPFARGRVFDSCEVDAGQYNTAAKVFWASGAAMFVRAAAFHDLGGFDEYFFAHQEEVDLCWRFQRAGFDIYAQPASVVYHVGGGTLPKGNSRKTFLNFRNNHIMLWKNLSRSQKCKIIPIRVMLDAVSAYKALLQGDAGFFKAVGQAHWAVLQWMLSHKKESNFKAGTYRDLAGVYKGNLAWQYFVRKKKKFSEVVNI